MYQAILFDLDGTLLPMDQQEFTAGYFDALCRRFAPLGYEPEQLVAAVWKGTKAMVGNDGGASNGDRFWAAFAEVYGQERLRDRAAFDDFYVREFNQAAAYTRPTPLAERCVREARAKGYPVILATNPIFPRTATLARLKWAGLKEEDFALITAYENSTHCKPNPAYYEEICRRQGLSPDRCLMVGNDAGEDLAAARIGMDVYLVTDCLIAPDGADLTGVRHGSMEELLSLIRALPEAR